MTAGTTEIDPRHAARLADRLRSLITKAEPALQKDELETLSQTASFLDDAAGVERGERVMERPTTGKTYVVHRWIELGDAGVIALESEPAAPEKIEAEDGGAG
jgi:hypothetical protein